jgi:hypothetical protein
MVSKKEKVKEVLVALLPKTSALYHGRAGGVVHEGNQ